jgi:hypothetical protein
MQGDMSVGISDSWVLAELLCCCFAMLPLLPLLCYCDSAVIAVLLHSVLTSPHAV